MKRRLAIRSRIFHTALAALLLGCSLVNASFAAVVQQTPAWNACSGPQAAFQISDVEMDPATTIPRGGAMVLKMRGTNQQQVTAGPGTVTVFYCWGRCWQVLTASDSLCPAPNTAAPHSNGIVQQASAQSMRSSLQGIARHASTSRKLQAQHVDIQMSSSSKGRGLASTDPSSTCTMGPGPMELQHAATLPGVAPRGTYKMRLTATDVVTQQELMCVEVWFQVG